MTQCNCKNTDELRIVRGNAFAIRLTVSAIHIDGTPVENFVLGDAEAVLKVMHLDEKTSKEFLIIGNDAIINFGGDLSLGWYGFEMTGTFNGKPWRWCVPQVFQVVETNAKANIPAWAVLTDETYAITGVMTITSGDIYQSDWNETDPQSPSYIKNKPDVVLHPEFNETVQRIERDIDDEETRAKGAERDLATAIGNEERDRKAADVTLQQNIDAEALARGNADTTLQGNIDAEERDRKEADVTLQQNIDAEALARGNADTTLQGNIDAEERDRKAADVTLQKNIDAEALARGNADTTLQGNIDAEETRAKAAEKQNADDIDAIEGIIPQQASSQNQLADKNFVNSSVATNTANYISDNGEPFTSLADLEAYSGQLTNNDYAFVVGTDQAGNTTYTRYKYSSDTEQWAEEYVLNNSSFTAEQWAAISSGITSGDVAKLDALPTKAQLDLLLAGKQDTISDLSDIRSGAAAGATAYQKPSGGIPKSDLVQSVQDSLSRADEAVVADGSGTSGQVLTSRGSGQEPGWQTGELVHPVTNVSGRAAVTTSGHYYSVKWIGQCEGITALRDGMMINIKIPVQGNSTYHTVLNINGLGEHPVCRNVTNEADVYVVDSIITLIYDANAQAPAFFDSGTATTVNGVWKIGDYDSQNTYQLRHASNAGTFIAATNLPEGVICLQKNETTLLPINATGGTGTSKVLTTESFNPFGAIVYVKGNYSANDNISSNVIFEQALFDLRISFNTGSTLTNNKDVYICAVPQSDGMAKLDVTTPIVQELPSADDGKIYIYIGHIGSSSKFELHPVHPVYWFKGGKVVPYTVLDISAKADKVSGAVGGNFAGLDSNGNLTDSGKKASDFATAAQGAKADQAETDINDIEAKIPTQASAQNQLADKDFVNSSIATNTATYRGAYNEVSDLELTTAATEQQIAAALATKMTALGITPDNNDYCFVQVPTADATPTEIARVDRYKYNGTAWAFEFSLNNSGFTAAQWAALNSGITSGLVTKLNDLPTDSELTTLLGGKEDKSNKVTSISAESTDTQYPSAKCVYDNTVNKLDKPLNITYAQLKALRDSGNLNPGQWYRITDYVTTTAQADTQSAGHPFDVIVMALEADRMSEVAFAAQHSGDTYFDGAQLEAWELRYCLDNDTDRFAWADATTTTTTDPETEEQVTTPNGKGVIYWMRDQNGNECPYDFKNIQFMRRPLTGRSGLVMDASYLQEATYDAEAVQAMAIIAALLGSSMSASNYGYYHSMGVGAAVLGSTLTSSYVNYNGNAATIDAEAYYMPMYNVNNHTIYCKCSEAVYLFTFHFRTNNVDLSLTDKNVNDNVIRPYFNSGKRTLNNIVFMFYNTSNYNSYGNSFGFDCYNNTFSQQTYLNTFGNDVRYNTFGNSVYYNTFGNYVWYNTFGNNVYNNTFGNSVYYNTFGNGVRYNTFGNNVRYNTFGNYVYNNTFGNNVYYNTFGNYVRYNTFGNNVQNNTFGNNVQNNTFGNGVQYVVYGQSVMSLGSYFYYNIIENGNQHLLIDCTETTSSSAKCQNIKVSQGVNNTTTQKTLTVDVVEQQYQITFQAAASEIRNV